MASNKKGSHAGTNHLYGSNWKHLRKEGKQQFWKKERHLSGLELNKNDDDLKKNSASENNLSNNALKKAKKQKKILKEHKKILKEIEKRAAE